MLDLVKIFNPAVQRKQNGKLSIVFITVCLFTQVTVARYGGGAGEPDDPYLIYTAEQMNTIGTEPNDWNKHFKLMADIDLAQYTGTQFNIIGYFISYSDNKPFTGVFDGNGHKISNFTYNSTDRVYVGLFGYVGENWVYPVIKDLGLLDPNVDAGTGYNVGNNVGGLAGYAKNATITGCWVEGGSVSGEYEVGGLIGIGNDVTISSCYSATNVQGANRVGGLFGSAYGVTFQQCHSNSTVTGRNSVGGLLGGGGNHIESCHSAGNVVGEDTVGGLVGHNSATVTSCYSTTTVIGSDERAGGLVGSNTGTLQSCRASGNVEGNNLVGGLAGSNTGTITHCYANGSVKGNRKVAGFVASNSIQIRFSYSTGSVEGNESVAGFANGGSVYLCYWDIETSGISESAAGKGKTTAQMQSASTYRGWGYESKWILDEGKDYPRLLWEETTGELLFDSPRNYGGGVGEPNDPYKISTAQQLASVAYYLEDYDKHFVLTNDIDFRAINQNDIVPIGTRDFPFVGMFDGNNHLITNFAYHVNKQKYTGVFGSIGQNGYIENMQLADISVTGNQYVGSLAGYNHGTIRRCSITGTVNGGNEVGGLAGYNIGTIQQCHVSAIVEGRDEVGGLTGQSGGSIIECSTSGQVAGDQQVGGLVGYDGNADILACFSTSRVSGRENVGGLAGKSDALILPASHAGPPPGDIPLPPMTHISSCYFAGFVEGQKQVGGLVGENGRSIRFCYSSGQVVNTNPSPNEQTGIGGLIGNNNYGVVLLSYWDTEVAGLSYSAAGSGKTTGQMMTADTFRGWDYVGHWILDEGKDYPRLVWEGLEGEFITGDPDRYRDGTGEPDDPFRICTPQDFINVGYYPGDWDKHFVLTNDLDMNDVNSARILPIGVYGLPFMGVFDGNNHTISNLKWLSETESFLSVFGSIGPEIPYSSNRSQPEVPNVTGCVLNLNIEKVGVLAYCCAGGLAGYNQGIISNCSVTGDVNAIIKDAGGLVGYNLGEITDCIAQCNVTSEEVAGGLIGHNRGPIMRCSFVGDVKAEGTYYRWCAGGLIGYNTNHIESCHFSGSITGAYNTGGLVGINSGDIINCSAEGDITGTQDVGGLIGENGYRVNISNSFSNCNVMGEERVGGLIGYNGGEILNCYAEGSVEGRQYVAGLAGSNSESILFCYANCTVSGTGDIAGLVAENRRGEITSCFWDTDVSGLINGVADQESDPEGIFGLSTAEMQTANTFLDAGWDFVDETANGTEDIWWIDEGRDYPRLWWETND